MTNSPSQAPVHVLVIPKKPIGGVEDFKEGDAPILGHLMISIPKVDRTATWA
jgi:diadenosine tetraphosphate (Ap4A) HIT family hydrolase